jgi:hypothetical protein
MQNAAGSGTSAASEDRIVLHGVIISDLMSLIESVQAGMELIATAIAREASLGNQEIAIDVVVLDDVTPGYAKVGAALNACNANLGAALHALLDTSSPQPGTDAARCNRRAFRAVG